MRWRWVALAIAALLFAPRPSLADGEPRSKVVVCVARETPAARVAADDVARALAPVAPVRVGAIGGRCDLDEPGERVLVVVDDADDRVVLSARGRAGRAWSPRTVERGGRGPMLFRELVAVAARSLVSAALDAEASPPAAASASPPGDAAAPLSSASPSPLAPPSPAASAPPTQAPPSAAASVSPPPASAAQTIDGRGETIPARAAAAPVLRLEASYAAVTIGSSLPVESGASIAAFWLLPRLRVGIAYAFFPGAGVASPDTSLVVTRHAAAAYAGLGYRTGALELGGAAGPLLDVWLRSTTATTGKATAPKSYAEPGVSIRADIGYALTPAFGLHAALSAEIAPWSPEFRGPKGTILDPAVVRARLDAGVTVAVF